MKKGENVTRLDPGFVVEKLSKNDAIGLAVYSGYCKYFEVQEDLGPSGFMYI